MGPVAGVRVLELGQLIAGPFCGQLLADFGADVVKIEPPGKGDAMRQWGRADENGNTLWWPVIARNKKSVTLDLRAPEGQDVLKELVHGTDILIENFRPGTMERWGLGWDVLSAVNPRLIMVRITGFGQEGPYAKRAGFASVCEAMAGFRYISGYPDRAPVRVGISIGDSLAGINGMMGALLALYHREQTGRGQVVDAAILESVLSVMESLVPEFDYFGYIRERTGSALAGIAPSNAYPAADGRDVVIGANQDSLFARLVNVMGQPELATDPRFVDHQARGRHQAVLDEIVAAWTRTLPAQEIVDLLAENGVAVGMAYRAPEMLEDPHFKARDVITRVDAPGLGPVAMQNVFPRLSETPGSIRHAGPTLGEHTDAVLGDWLEYDTRRIDDLRARGII
jgi:formyl-CoA transferase